LATARGEGEEVVGVVEEVVVGEMMMIR